MRGDQHFKEQALDQSLSLGKEADKKGRKQLVTISAILMAVSKHYEVSLNDLKVARRGRGLKSTPRRVAMKLCQQLAGATLKEIAEVFHVGHYSTVSQTIGRLNREMEESQSLAKAFRLLKQALTP